MSTCWPSAGRQQVRLRADPPPPLPRCCFAAHTDILVPLPHTGILVSLGVAVGLMVTRDLRELCSLRTAEPNAPLAPHPEALALAEQRMRDETLRG